jgi:hypothetical protein
MAKTLVEKEICDACGADVRPGSLFCYNCGGAVSEDPEKFAKTNNKKNISAALKSDLSENNDLKTAKLKKDSFEAVADQPIKKPTAELLEKIAEKPIEKPLIQEEAKLKSAANLRRRAKSFQRKTVEVVWEEPENAPNKWFPLVAIVLILLVVAIFYLAMYLK